MTIYIRALKVNDLEQYNEIRNLFVNVKSTVDNTKTHMLNFIGETNVIRYGIYNEQTHYLIGYCTIGNINYVEKYCSIHIAIIPIHQKKGFGTEALEMLHTLIFDIYKLNYIFLTVDENNQIAKHIYTKLGYVFVNFNPTENKEKYCNMINNNKIINLQFVWDTYPDTKIQEYLINKTNYLLVSNDIL